MTASILEDTLALHIRATNLPEPVREFRFKSDRRWRFDFAWPLYLLAVECDGGVWKQGRHTRGAGWEADAEKLNTAALLGWAVFRFSAKSINSGDALRMIGLAINARSPG